MNFVANHNETYWGRVYFSFIAFTLDSLNVIDSYITDSATSITASF